MFGISASNFLNFGGSKDKQFGSTQYWTPEQKQISKNLADYMGGKIGAQGPYYGGERVAGMSQPEQGSIQALNAYMRQRAPQQWTTAGQTINRALGGDYSNPIVTPDRTAGIYNWGTGQALGTLDQSQSKPIVNDAATTELYNRIRDQVMQRDLPELQNTAAQNANLRGMYFSGGHEKMQTDLMKDAQANLLDTLANLRYSDESTRRDIEREREGRRYATLSDLLGTSTAQRYADQLASYDIGREREGRQLQAVPAAMDLGSMYDTYNLNKAAAGQTYGTLPRQLSQQELDAMYQEFLRRLPQNQPVIDQALQYLARQGYQSGDWTKSGDYWDTGVASKFSYGMMGMGGGGS